MSRTVTKALRVARAVKDFPKLSKELTKHGWSMQKLSDYHFRFTREGMNIKCDYWPTTTRWANLVSRGKGSGWESFKAHLAKMMAEELTPQPKPDVTIFADASVCVTTKAGGWGAWMIRTGAPAADTGGQLRDVCESSTAAEIQALANAVFHAVRTGYIRPGDKVMLQSDNVNALSVIHYMTPKSVISNRQDSAPIHKTPRSKYKKHPAVELVADLAKQHGLIVILRHVYGHRAGDGRQWVNRRCDEIAKAHMRLRRARVHAERETNAA